MRLGREVRTRTKELLHQREVVQVREVQGRKELRVGREVRKRTR